MAPIEAKNYQCKMGCRGFETRKNQGGYKTETAVSLQQICLQIQLDSDNLLGPFCKTNIP